jgi:3-(3-hydroxy-phenyl)propionate hydroxylase
MTQRFDVALVGAGPTGLVLANLLGQCGVQTVVIERGIEVFPVPRATHMDEETVRNLALTGLLPQLAQHMSTFGHAEVTDSKGRVIFRQRVGLNDPIHGRQGSFFFDQPEIEQVLKDGLKRYGCISLISGATVTKVETEGHHAIVSADTDQAGNSARFIARYVVGCDGGKSIVRKAIGTDMRTISPPTNWMVIDTVLKHAADAALLPSGFQYRMGSAGLSLYAHGHGLNRRWEFRLNDVGRAMTEAEALDQVARYIDLHRLNILRITRYVQNGLVAEEWTKGPLILAGDAAHMMPPDGGQGMCSGIRDAVNLSWKLNHVLRGGSGQVLHSYQKERMPHLIQLLRNAMFIGRRVSAASAIERRWKELQFWVLARFSLLRNKLRGRILRPFPLTDGFFDRRAGGGQHLPNFTVGDVRIDTLWGLGWAVVGGADAFGPALSVRLNALGMASIGNHPGHLPFSVEAAGWLARNGAQLAIVRPDRIIYALVSAPDVQRYLDELEKAGVGRMAPGAADPI